MPSAMVHLPAITGERCHPRVIQERRSQRGGAAASPALMTRSLVREIFADTGHRPGRHQVGDGEKGRSCNSTPGAMHAFEISASIVTFDVRVPA